MIKKDKIKRACELAIKNLLNEGATDVDLFTRPFEIDLLKNNNFCNEIISKVSLEIQKNNFSDLKLHKIGHVLVPKKSLSDYRKCALIDIYDEIVYLTLVIIIAPEIEKKRINRSKNIVYSYRYDVQANGLIFDPKYHYSSFKDSVSRKSNFTKNKIIVECDISNFYDRLNIHRIESVLMSIDKVDNDIVNLINELLLFWADRDSYGLPVGSNGSRILAEVALIEVDNFLTSKGVDFCRFVDDYRIFAKDAYTAHSHLAILNQCLSREGLFLNNQKTKISDISHLQNIKKEVKTSDENKHHSNSREIEDLPKIIRGYSGLIPTKFRELSESQIVALKDSDLNELLTKAKDELLIEPKQLVTLIKTIVAQEKFEEFSKMPFILKKFPQFIPYFVDVLIKKGDKLDKRVIEEIKIDFSEWFNDEDAPEYILVYLVRLFSSERLEDKNTLLNAFRKLKRNSGDYIGRALLEALDGKLTRGELLEIRDYYYRADRWEAREIIKLVNQGFSSGEKRPFFKDIKIHNDDLFVGQVLKGNSKQ